MPNLYIDTSTGDLVSGLNSAAGASASDLPLFYGDPAVPFNIWLLVPLLNPAPGQWPYTILSTAGLTLNVFVTDGSIAGTYGNGNPYTSQIVWATDAKNTYFSANLSFNTVNLQTAIGSLASLKATFKVGYIAGGNQTTVFSGQITIGVGIPTSAANVPAGFTPLSVEVANQTFVPIQPVAGQPIYLKSPNGRTFALQIVDNGDGTASFAPSQLN